MDSFGVLLGAILPPKRVSDVSKACPGTACPGGCWIRLRGVLDQAFGSICSNLASFWGVFWEPFGSHLEGIWEPKAAGPAQDRNVETSIDHCTTLCVFGKFAIFAIPPGVFDSAINSDPIFTATYAPRQRERNARTMKAPENAWLERLFGEYY